MPPYTSMVLELLIDVVGPADRRLEMALQHQRTHPAFIRPLGDTAIIRCSRDQVWVGMKMNINRVPDVDHVRLHRFRAHVRLFPFV